MATLSVNSIFVAHNCGHSLVNQKAAIVKKLKGLGKKEVSPAKGALPSAGGTASLSGRALAGIAALRNLVESGSDSLLNSDDPAQRIKGLVGIKKYVSKQLAAGNMSADRAHDLLEELSMLMRTILNDTNPDVYAEALKLLKFALTQLLKYLTPFDLQITVNTIIGILTPKTIASPSYKIQIASDKFIISLGKESLIGPIIIIKNLFRLMDKLAGESNSFNKSMRMSSSQHGFYKQAGTGSGFDLAQNIAAVSRYLGIANLVLTHYKTAIAHSKEAIECFAETAVGLWAAYANKPQVREAVGLISREVRAVDPRAFESKKEGEARTKLMKILSAAAAAGELEEQTMSKQLSKRRLVPAAKVASMETRESVDTMLPSVYTPSTGGMLSSRGMEEQKAGKPLPSYAKRIGKTIDPTAGASSPSNSGAMRQSVGLPPLGRQQLQQEKVRALPPLVMRRNQPLEPKKELTVLTATTSAKKPSWLTGDEGGEKRFYNTKGDFNEGKRGLARGEDNGAEEDVDDIIKAKASMSHPFRFPK